jgi:four helix bundle protein|tara:strand:- start:177 stop:557 length:381 start_codon:yes stop_codon:yes gene_type:complete
MQAKSHKKMLFLQKGMELVLKLYRLTNSFPKEREFGLISQIRHAAVSVPANISGGAANRSKDQFRNYPGIAIGSLNELSTVSEISLLVRHLSESVQKQVEECLALTFSPKKKLTKQPITAYCPLFT